MTELYAALAERVDAWRADGYPHEDFPAIAEILDFAFDGPEDARRLRYLRTAQLRALETYWWLRLVAGTPRIPELYEAMFERTTERLAALGLNHAELRDIATDFGYPTLVERLRTDDDLARRHRLDALRETFALDYPSWILALAMGAGKTVLVGAIVATEFAMALEYPDASDTGSPFIENALVFAPGTTILESLRELATIPYDRILPPRLHGPFATSLKVTFTRDGERDIPVIRSSRFNLVVTNTEKIRIQASPRRRGGIGRPVEPLWDRRDDEATEIANLRLQAIASLPHLGVFSDEAHHTYGRSLGTDLKRVRQTVDYLAAATNVVCVVNTTGTPYFERQPLRDVVVWYGLRQGIEDDVLKEVAGNIEALDFDPAHADEFVAYAIETFFRDYGDHALPDGSPAKIAIYFPQNDDLDELAPHVELAVARAGLPPTAILRNTTRSTAAEVDDFNRLNDPGSTHRVILLVNKGTEGWNCPSLFATALARRLRTSQNFVLQAASRCLRQVPGNDRPARIYLSAANRSALDTQLRETYGESLADLDGQRRASQRATIRLRKPNLPHMRLHVPGRALVRDVAGTAALEFEPPTTERPAMTRTVLDIGVAAATRRVLRQVGDAVTIESAVDAVSPYAAAVGLAANHRADPWVVLAAIRAAYGGRDVPVAHLDHLSAQLEAHLGGYRETETDEVRELEIVKPDGFDTVTVGGEDVHEAEISYPVDRDHLIWAPDRIRENPGDYGFHYSPYNFDSRPEADFFERVVRVLNLEPRDVQDVYFTGAITDPKKTDIAFAYETDGRDHWYTPDFVVHAAGDRWMLVEVKMTRRRDDPVEGENGVKAASIRRLEAANPDRLVYRIVFADEVVSPRDVGAVEQFLQER